MENKITETDYSPDFEISKRYIDFSAELLRISLLAITGIGSIIINPLDQMTNPKWLLISVGFFVMAICGALTHRFYATDCLSYQISYLRKEDKEKKEKEKLGYIRCLKKAEYYLIFTECFFGLSIITFVVIFIILFK